MGPGGLPTPKPGRRLRAPPNKPTAASGPGGRWGRIVLVLGVGRCAFRPPRVVFVLGLVSLINSLTSGKNGLLHRRKSSLKTSGSSVCTERYMNTLNTVSAAKAQGLTLLLSHARASQPVSHRVPTSSVSCLLTSSVITLHRGSERTCSHRAHRLLRARWPCCQPRRPRLPQRTHGSR